MKKFFYILKSHAFQSPKSLMILVLSTSFLAVLINKPVTVTSEKNIVKILTWWGYLSNQKKLEAIEHKCQTNLEVIEYLSIEDLLSLSKINKYDIYIYPLAYKKNIDKYLIKPAPDISNISLSYLPTIRDRYTASKLESNTVFFQDSVSIYIHNKLFIDDIKELKIKNLFNYAKYGKVYLQNEFKQIDWLLSQSDIPKNKIWDNFYTLLFKQYTEGAYNSGFEFSNFINDYLDENLVLGYLDSGEALNPNINWNTINKQGNIQFSFHSTLSHISSDVLSINSHSKEAICVAQKMGSKEFLSWVSKENYYFNPYGDIPKKLSPRLKAFSESYYKNANKIPWLDLESSHATNNPDSERKWAAYSECYHNRDCSKWLALMKH
jgi:hypothetical protein